MPTWRWSSMAFAASRAIVAGWTAPSRRLPHSRASARSTAASKEAKMPNRSSPRPASSQLAAGGLDVRPSLPPDGHLNAPVPDDPGEAADRFRRRALVAGAGHGVQRDEVDVAEHSLKERHQACRLLGAVVDAPDHHVFERHPPVGPLDVLPAGIKQ